MQHAGKAWRKGGGGHYICSQIGSRADNSPNKSWPWRAHLDDLRACLKATVALQRHGDVCACVRTTILYKTHRNSACRFPYSQCFLISEKKKIARPSVHQLKVTYKYYYFVTLGLEIMMLNVIKKFHFLLVKRTWKYLYELLRWELH